MRQLRAWGRGIIPSLLIISFLNYVPMTLKSSSKELRTLRVWVQVYVLFIPNKREDLALEASSGQISELLKNSGFDDYDSYIPQRSGDSALLCLFISRTYDIEWYQWHKRELEVMRSFMGTCGGGEFPFWVKDPSYDVWSSLPIQALLKFQLTVSVFLNSWHHTSPIHVSTHDITHSYYIDYPYEPLHKTHSCHQTSYLYSQILLML